jgi:hypothetical protein
MCYILQASVCIPTVLIRHANRISSAPYHMVICGLLAVSQFSTLSHKQHDFRELVKTKYNFILYSRTTTVAWVCGRSLAGIVGSNPAGRMDVFYWECYVLSGKGLCVGIITRSDKSSQVSLCPGSVIAKPHNGRSWSGTGSMRQRKKSAIYYNI